MWLMRCDRSAESLALQWKGDVALQRKSDLALQSKPQRSASLSGERRMPHAAIIAILLTAACGGNSGGTQPPVTTVPPQATSSNCSIPLAPAARASISAPLKPASTDDRRTRRGRAYEELWKHQAAVARRRSALSSIAPAASAEDIGQVAV